MLLCDRWTHGSWASSPSSTAVVQDVTRGDIDLSPLWQHPIRLHPRSMTPQKALLERATAVLADKVSAVLASQRLTESPSCLTRGEDELGEQMRRMLAAAGRTDVPDDKPRLELNLAHPLVLRLAGLEDEDFSDLVQLLYDQAQLTEQGQVSSPGDFAQRLNRLLLKLLK